MSRNACVATLIGDLIGSRAAADRAHMHVHLEAAINSVNAGPPEWAPTVPLRITVGDEYQGCFDSVGAAVRASLRLRLALLPDVDVRHGIGWGGTTVLREQPRVEDGPGWWAARNAIEEAEELASRPALRSLRTAYHLAEGTPGPDPAPVNAALGLRDAQVTGLSEASVMVVRGLLQGRTQRKIAADIGVSTSALSQRVRRDGLAMLLRADELLGEVR